MCMGDGTWSMWSSAFHAFILMVQSYNGAEVRHVQEVLTYSLGRFNSTYVLFTYLILSLNALYSIYFFLYQNVTKTRKANSGAI